MVPIRVMLVDDNEIVRKGLQDALERSDYFTVVGQTGEGVEALELARRLRPDVILLDVLMPVKNGIDVCREITTAMPNVKVFMLSALSDRDASNRAIAAGATGYLPKLWGRDQLLNTLRDAAQGRYRSPYSSAAGKGPAQPFGKS